MAIAQMLNSASRIDVSASRIWQNVELKMDSVLTNDLALAFQLVSEKEKKKNRRLSGLTKKIVSTVLKIKKDQESKQRNKNAEK